VSAIQGIYENGMVRLLEPVDLPEGSRVEIIPKRRTAPVTEIDFTKHRDMTAIYEILSRRYSSGRSDISERHNEHQPRS